MCSGILALMVLALLTACAASATPTWQEEYDLGVRYLTEGNYEEASIAFTAAIEIDPKRPEAYVGLADAFQKSGNPDMAIGLLNQALGVVEDGSVIEKKLDELTPDRTSESRTRVEEGDGWTQTTDYDEMDRVVESVFVDHGEERIHEYYSYSEDGTTVTIQVLAYAYEDYYENDGEHEVNERRLAYSANYHTVYQMQSANSRVEVQWADTGKFSFKIHEYLEENGEIETEWCDEAGNLTEEPRWN